MNRSSLAVALLLIAFLTAPSARGSFISVAGNTGDGEVDVTGLAGSLSATQVRVGVGGNDVRGIADIFFFALPTLPSSASLLAADLKFQYLGISQFTILVTPEFNADLYGLGTRSTPTILSTDYYDGNPASSPVTLLAKSLITPTTAPGSLQVAGSSFSNYIASLYNPNGTPSAAYAVFRMNADVHLPPFSSPYRGYELASAENTDGGGAPPGWT